MYANLAYNLSTHLSIQHESFANDSLDEVLDNESFKIESVFRKR